jgi:hypothetical protein
MDEHEKEWPDRDRRHCRMSCWRVWRRVVDWRLVQAVVLEIITMSSGEGGGVD